MSSNHLLMKPPPPSSSAHMRSVYDVLCDMWFLRYITSFQCGFPHDIVEWKRAYDSIPSPWGSPRQPWGLLPNLAVQTNNLRMLKRLHRYHKEQYDSITQMAFQEIWHVALKCGNLEMAQWIVTKDPLVFRHYDDEREDATTIQCAISSPSVEMTKWLLVRRPRYKLLGQLFDLNEVAATGNIEVYQWLMETITGIAISSEQMDIAADKGHLQMVRYLHDHSTAGCTTEAMDNAACRGHLEIVTFLHEHRTEGCTTDAMDYAAHSGHLEIVQFLHDHRTEGCTANAMDYAASNGHLDIVKFLCENRTEGCPTDAKKQAIENRHLDIVTFLGQKCSGRM